MEGDLDLLPINFFLHNRDGDMSVDELVIQAIECDHSKRFDRLAMFALNLNQVGSGRDARSRQQIVSRPAMWANEFVREELWSQGTWQARALSDDLLDQFLTNRMGAQYNVRVKCRNNYRYLFRLCDYWPATLPIINSGAEQWIASALFLAWDRHILDGGAQDKATLLRLIDLDELYKLLGVTLNCALGHADRLFDLYETVGYVDRFKESANVPSPAVPEPEVPEEAGIGWLDQGESDGVVERRLVERSEQKRDRRKAIALKRLYGNTCQFCGTRLQVAEDRFYSEAAHIKGLGEPHNGPDMASNMLVLCPNHHLQFDRGVLRLQKVGTDYQIHAKTAGEPLHGKTIMLTHSIEDDYVIHHYNWFG